VQAKFAQTQEANDAKKDTASDECIIASFITLAVPGVGICCPAMDPRIGQQAVKNQPARERPEAHLDC